MNATLAAKITAVLPTLQGWCTPQKALGMAELILQVKPATVVEIGVFGGSSLIPQALALKETGGVVHGVDPWKIDSAIEGEKVQENIDWWNSVNLDDILGGFYKAILDAQVARHVTVHPVPGHVAREYFQTNSIEVLHIDGCHSEVSSTRDVLDWLPKVVNGGYIWFDDTDWPSTAKAVSMISAKCKQVWKVGSCALFRKGQERWPFTPISDVEPAPTVAPLPSVEDSEQPAPEHILAPSV